MRIVVMTCSVEKYPEAKHGTNGDYVLLRVASQEFNEDEAWKFNVICKGQNAKTVLERMKTNDQIIIEGDLLKPYNNKGDGAIYMKSFEWQRGSAPKQEKQDDGGFDFGIEDFDAIPDIPYGDE